jgi:hypothetical protein
VDIDELLALACVFEVCPVDLMVSKEATDEPYAVTPGNEFEAQSMRDWIRGESVRLVPVQQPAEPGEPTFADPAKRCSRPSNGCPNSGLTGSAADSSQGRNRHEHAQARPH